MNPIWIMTGKEVRDGLRNRWVLDGFISGLLSITPPGKIAGKRDCAHFTTLTTGLLLNSPVVSVVKWAQSRFPAILPGGVIDSKPLMKPSENPLLADYLAIKDDLYRAAAQRSQWAGEADEFAQP